MKQGVEKRKPSGVVDYVSLALTTFGVGYIPGAPGTYGSAVAVIIFAVSLIFSLLYQRFVMRQDYQGEVT